MIAGEASMRFSSSEAHGSQHSVRQSSLPQNQFARNGAEMAGGSLHSGQFGVLIIRQACQLQLGAQDATQTFYNERQTG